MTTSIVTQSGAFPIADADIVSGDDSVTYRCTGAFAITLPSTGVTAGNVFIIQSIDGLQTFTTSGTTTNIPQDKTLTPYGTMATVGITCVSTGVYDVTGDLSASGGGTGVVGTAIVQLGTKVTVTVAQIPWDDTIPQSNEGQEILTLTYTPKYADSILRVEGSFWGYLSQSYGITALFRDLNVDADAVALSWGSILYDKVDIDYEYPSNATIPTTFKIRMGASVLFYLNAGSTGIPKFGGTSNTFLRVTEIRVT